jgi:hypothetical protein
VPRSLAGGTENDQARSNADAAPVRRRGRQGAVVGTNIVMGGAYMRPGALRQSDHAR